MSVSSNCEIKINYQRLDDMIMIRTYWISNVELTKITGKLPNDLKNSLAAP